MRLTFALCSLVLVGVGCGGGSDGAVGPDDTDNSTAALSDGDFVIRAVHSGRCLDVPAASKDNGARLQQYDCNGTGAQLFHLTEVGGGFFEITNVSSGKSLDISDVRTDAGAPLQQWQYGGGANQQFALVDVGNGEVSIRARHSGLALDVSGASTENLAPIVQWPANDGKNQRWRFEGKGAPDPGPGPTPAPSDWKLTWSDEFDGGNGSAADAGKWSRDVGGSGWGNQELEYYTDNLDNAHQENGSLVIKATQEGASQFACWYGPCRYTSARLISAHKFEQAYGRIESRIKVPRGQGIWPAFWMLGADIGQVGWPTCGEIDIMENVGYEPGINHGSLHGPGYSGGSPRTATYTLPGGAQLADDFHLFSIEWEPNVIRFYVDDNLYQTRTPADLPAGTKWVYDHPFFMLLNVAVGGQWPGEPNGATQFPQTMQVDYVRVYQRQ